MNLVELVHIIRQPNKDIEQEIGRLYPELDIDYADIYFEKAIAADSPLHFLNNEELSEGIEFDFNGITYINLFPLHYLLEFYDDIADAALSDLEISNRIISYRLNDA